MIPKSKKSGRFGAPVRIWGATRSQGIQVGEPAELCRTCGHVNLIAAGPCSKCAVTLNTPKSKLSGEYISDCCHADAYEDFEENPADHHDPHPIYRCRECGNPCDLYE